MSWSPQQELQPQATMPSFLCGAVSIAPCYSVLCCELKQCGSPSFTGFIFWAVVFLFSCVSPDSVPSSYLLVFALLPTLVVLFLDFFFLRFSLKLSASLKLHILFCFCFVLCGFSGYLNPVYNKRVRCDLSLPCSSEGLLLQQPP